MPQVVIVGGGFSGCVLAMCLKKHGISSAIYEIREKGARQGGNIALAPNALRVLDHIGCYGRVRLMGYNYEGLRYDNGKGEVLGSLLQGSKEVYNFKAVRIHRADVHAFLVSEAESRGIPIYYDKRCERIVEETSSNATVEFTDGETVTADFVVGTDGIHSQVREHIAPNIHPHYTGLSAIMGAVQKDIIDKEVAESLELPCMIFGTNGSFAIMPSNFDGTEIGYFATLQESDRSREEWAELAADKDRMYQMLETRYLDPDATYPELVRQLCKKSDKHTLTSWPFFGVPYLSHWTGSHRRVVIIGDAAHAISPTGGQGAAMALEDAETLAYVLAKIYAPDFYVPPQCPSPSLTPPVNGGAGGAGGLDEVFQAWETHRLARIQKVKDFTNKNGSLRKSTPHFYEQAAREWLIWAVFTWMGPQGGAHWLYSYNPENVLGVLP